MNEMNGMNPRHKWQISCRLKYTRLPASTGLAAIAEKTRDACRVVSQR